METTMELQQGAYDWLITMEKGCQQLHAVVGVLLGQMQKGSKVVVGEMKLDEWLEARGQDMLEIMWELEEGPDPRFEAYLDWRRLDAKMGVCQALFREGRDLRWRMEEWLEEDNIGADGGLPLVHSPAGRGDGTIVSADQPGITEGPDAKCSALVKGTTATSSPIPPISAATAQGLTTITAEIPSQTTEAVLMEVLELGVVKMTTSTAPKMTTSTTAMTITTATVTPTTTLTTENSIITGGGKGATDTTTTIAWEETWVAITKDATRATPISVQRGRMCGMLGMVRWEEGMKVCLTVVPPPPYPVFVLGLSSFDRAGVG
ncbi:hypothetical protein CBR_g21125 [Chara braunii]|uniref:Uncharacterized protein n=1 Tax=Chara braunii TaxID=69332 RepID=A0A388L0Z3_CHABU|nr:hypothetical protein CBR_g21125 [Chara braunii]|eukprot:GBG75883.1 hypothetical protein CBR_g21125 [Chara braunii]